MVVFRCHLCNWHFGNQKSLSNLWRTPCCGNDDNDNNEPEPEAAAVEDTQRPTKCIRTTVQIDKDDRHDNVQEHMADTNIINDMDENVIDVNELEDDTIKIVADKYDLIELNENDDECDLELNEDDASETDVVNKTSSKLLITFQNNIGKIQDQGLLSNNVIAAVELLAIL